MRLPFVRQIACVLCAHRKMVLMLLVTGLLITTVSGQATAQRGYLATPPGAAMFIQFTELNGRISGQLQIFGVERRSSLRPVTSNTSFSGIRSGSNISLRAHGLFSERALSGTLTTARLSLVVPSKDGTLSSWTFTRATIGEYNAAVRALRQRMEQANARQAEKNRADTINTEVQQAFEQVTLRIKALADIPSFDRVSGSFDYNYQVMQKHESDFKNKAQAHPLDSFKVSEAEYALSLIKYDLSTIDYDRSQLDYAVRDVTERIEGVRASMSELQKVLNEWSVALASDKRNEVRLDVTPDLIKRYEREAETEIERAKTAITLATNHAKQITE